MTNDFAMFGQKQLPLITQAEIDAFNMERFQFAKDVQSAKQVKRVHDVPGKAVGVSPLEAMRAASMKLIEAAFGVSNTEPPAITDTVLQRYTGRQDDLVW
jgi:hypothetical protein